MHDFLEGICQLELKLFLKLLVQEKLDSIKEINDWKVILLLIEIVKIVFAPILHDTLVIDLENLIENYHKLYLSEYNTHLTPKHHMIIHLPTVIKRMGPPRHFWTMRFESKHGYLKDLSKKL